MNQHENTSHPALNQFARVPGLLKRMVGKDEIDLRDKYKPMTDEETAEWHRARLDARLAGPGLKEYDLDENEYRRPIDKHQFSAHSGGDFGETFAGLLADYIAAHPDREPDGTNDDQPLFTKLMYSSELQSKSSPELSEWLANNTPQNGFFTPQMVAEAVADNPNVIVQQQREGDLDVWRFSDQDGNNIALTRRTPGTAKYTKSFIEPYLGVLYPGEYDFDTKEVVSSPQLWLNPHAPDPEGTQYKMLKSPLAGQIINSLDLRPIRTPVEIDFRVVGPKPVPYLTSGDANSGSLESVISQTHVEADFTHPEQYLHPSLRK